MSKFQRKPIRKRKPMKGMCYFCKNKVDPDYKDADSIGRFISDRGRILSRSKSGVCQKHQRALSKDIKRARFLGLLPFLVKPS